MGTRTLADVAGAICVGFLPLKRREVNEMAIRRCKYCGAVLKEHGTSEFDPDEVAEAKGGE